ncbi:hypothetical protein [uncultured Thiocystis sp.]|jgi:hypothetical protein|uniref:hypothetical protein n=1 Tax=uncultured Thiocystis sp. TaxID=1202134 RepID=UPI0025DB686F|nr:hypothetical protein [uncultured Thiocystis sp.]
MSEVMDAQILNAGGGQDAMEALDGSIQRFSRYLTRKTEGLSGCLGCLGCFISSVSASGLSITVRDLPLLMRQATTALSAQNRRTPTSPAGLLPLAYPSGKRN